MWDFKQPFFRRQANSFREGYVGHGIDTITQFNLNAGFILGAGANGQPENPTYGRQVSTVEFWQGFSSRFHALEAKVDRHFSHGFYMTNAFTWEKAMDYHRATMAYRPIFTSASNATTPAPISTAL